MPDLVVILIVILVIAVLLRGPKTLPEIGSMFGRGTKNLREELGGKHADGDGPDGGPST